MDEVMNELTQYQILCFCEEVTTFLRKWHNDIRKDAIDSMLDQVCHSLRDAREGHVCDHVRSAHDIFTADGPAWDITENELDTEE